MNLRTCIAGGILVLGVAGPATAAFAADDPYTKSPPSSVLGVEIERGSTDALPTNASTAAAPSSGQTLPVTGSDLVGLTAIGLLAIGTGTVLVRRSRLQPATAPAEA